MRPDFKNTVNVNYRTVLALGFLLLIIKAIR
jgi:hypothetical protein